MAYVDRECALITLDAASAANGEFAPTDRDDKRYAKWLEDQQLFESFSRRNINGRNQVIFKLTNDGRAVWQGRRNIRMAAFQQIAAKNAAEMAAS